MLAGIEVSVGLSGEAQRQGWRWLAPMDGFTAFPGKTNTGLNASHVALISQQWF